MPTRRGSALLLTSAAALALLAGCAGDDPAGADSPGTVAGTWTAPAGAGEAPTLELSADGTVSGTDGCNRLTGSWTESDGAVELGPLAVTQMACEGVDDWLSRAMSVTVDGDTMTVRDVGGQQIGTLSRD